MGAATPFLMMAGTAMQVIGQLQQGKAAAAVGDRNAAMLEQNAAIERQQAGAREVAKRREAAQILGQQRAALAQSGGGMGGSAADIMEQSTINSELDALTLRYEGEMRARGLQQEASMERYAGAQAKSQSRMAAVGSILSGAANYGAYQAEEKYRSEQLKRTRGY